MQSVLVSVSNSTRTQEARPLQKRRKKKSVRTVETPCKQHYHAPSLSPLTFTTYSGPPPSLANRETRSSNSESKSESSSSSLDAFSTGGSNDNKNARISEASKVTVGVNVPGGVVPSGFGVRMPFVPVPFTLRDELEPPAWFPLEPFIVGEIGVSGLVAECGGSSDVDIARAPWTALAAARWCCDDGQSASSARGLRIMSWEPFFIGILVNPREKSKQSELERTVNVVDPVQNFCKSSRLLDTV